MADEPQGPGWWQASDGAWYPPELHPDAPPPTPPTAPIAPIESPPTFAAPPSFVASPPLPGPPQADPAASWGTPPAPPAKSRSTALIIAIAIAVVAVVAVVAVAVGAKDDTTTNAASKSSSDATESTNASDSTAPAPVDVPAGWTVLQGDGVSLAVPPHWRELDAGALASNSDALSDLANANSDASDLLGMGAAMLAHGAKLAAGSSSGAEFAVVVKLPLNLDPQSAAAKSQMRAGLEAAGATDIAMTDETLPAGNAVRITATENLTVPDGSSVSALDVSYLIDTGSATYELTMSAVSPGTTDDFDTIASTFATT